MSRLTPTSFAACGIECPSAMWARHEAQPLAWSLCVTFSARVGSLIWWEIGSEEGSTPAQSPQNGQFAAPDILREHARAKD